MNFQDLDTLQFEVGRAMSNNETFRSHQGRESLINYIKDLGIECSMESITRAQRHLWTIAIDNLEKGNFEYAFKFIPSEKEAFEEWMRTRKVDAETYRQYYKNYKTKTHNLEFISYFNCRVCGNRVKGNAAISNSYCRTCQEKISR